MKKTIILLTSLILILTFTITACSGEAAEAVNENPAVPEITEAESGGEIQNTPESTGTVTLNTDYDNALPVQMQLILSTFKLDETENTVDADQAAELLPLWKAARSLSQSDTVAAEETDAIFNQIAATMTAEQLEAIVAMQLSQNDFADLSESLGIEMNSGGKFGDMTTEEIAAAQAARGGGQAPPGGGAPGAGPGGVDPGSNPPGGAVPGVGPRGAASRINTRFFDAIIELLEAKVQ